MNTLIPQQKEFNEISKDNRNSDSTVYSTSPQSDHQNYSLIFHLPSQKHLATSFLQQNQKSPLMQPNITPEMIQKVVDWLFSIFWRLDLTPDMIFLSLKIMRLYLKNQVIQKSKLQGLGITSMFIASKFIQVKRMKIDEIEDLVSGLYSQEDIICMQEDILNVLDYNLDLPTLSLYLECLKEEKNWSREEEDKMLFWLELGSVYELLGDKKEGEMVKEVFEFVTGSEEGFMPGWIEKLIGFCEGTQLKYVMKKFMSCFEVEEYLEKVKEQMMF